MYAPKLGIFKQAALSAALSLGFVQAASAGLIFSNTQPEAGTFNNVRFDRGGAYPGPNYKVQGTTVPLNSNVRILNFSSNEYLTGEVDTQWLRGSDAGFKELKVNVQDSVFTMFSLNLFAPSIAGNPKNRFVDVTVNAFGESPVIHRINIVNGANWFRVNATDDTLLRSLAFTSSTDIAYARAIRVGGAQDAPLPEPATLFSLGAGVLGMMVVRRRRKPQ
ncbi:PEP-CTERM sorting domain-containing protein [Massilia niastensis]|uniref:PEP-CTERM sorting domain-containing protein n=1 Tax=Massilia niastensis TaxID=544911 RepID=UPI00036E7977|nr:PEP-CTERM sorting domain-containing protein [Massilia niastensis]